MRFQTELVPARLIRRYKRFLADCRLEDGTEVVAHCANPGSMMGLADEGIKIWLEPNDDPKKKLNYGWRLVDHEDGNFTGVDTSLPNKAVRAALETGGIAGLENYKTVRPEVKYGTNSRIDFLLSEPGLPDAYVEVKSVTLSRQKGLAEFPDSVTARGAKHMGELTEVARAGQRAVLLYLVQRTDCTHVAMAADIDPTYAAAHATATAAGVETLCIGTHITPQAVTIAGPLALDRPTR
ncbi:DNA/RNA nuclease SfsA [Sulfitobacter sp. M57]|uniref:DNA/RNA nuclease SfsA n=1 Tax=unclassified Sulfitobacter TaxID=196795 RepID=UPI0023E106A9|nr:MULTISPECIES: DNA/RNA nuclease SfsA [unclassified Sulfitobacter]MDF3414701.1 DNA/RNA nuclease SfsA [Sulfitobacter sp. KE5]MDF3422182.1 DNA/RNA nuclease SfsA [Sulfitobacter sp. KE43]MDF3433247.1 DNA/RNA nuclease SfsA [Sulfitobacter sp. KE42]MDF3458887.1 DNA/RNA nuclease SfsA [Sulfitobacter sp. S74]MDF3462786.1 DNA/RNA nuclease SfsA [Sulfitobacter sp. Ks18]